MLLYDEVIVPKHDRDKPVAVKTAVKLLSTGKNLQRKKHLKPLLWRLEMHRCHYSHIFAVCWTHKIAVKSFSHAQNQKATGRAF
jgi:hypothetical protein